MGQRKIVQDFVKVQLETYWLTARCVQEVGDTVVCHIIHSDQAVELDVVDLEVRLPRSTVTFLDREPSISPVAVKKSAADFDFCCIECGCKLERCSKSGIWPIMCSNCQALDEGALTRAEKESSSISLTLTPTDDFSDQMPKWSFNEFAGFTPCSLIKPPLLRENLGAVNPHSELDILAFEQFFQWNADNLLYRTLSQITIHGKQPFVSKLGAHFEVHCQWPAHWGVEIFDIIFDFLYEIYVPKICDVCKRRVEPGPELENMCASCQEDFDYWQLRDRMPSPPRFFPPVQRQKKPESLWTRMKAVVFGPSQSESIEFDYDSYSCKK